jgi:hypothetical protein
MPGSIASPDVALPDVAPAAACGEELDEDGGRNSVAEDDGVVVGSVVS